MRLHTWERRLVGVGLGPREPRGELDLAGSRRFERPLHRGGELAGTGESISLSLGHRPRDDLIEQRRDSGSSRPGGGRGVVQVRVHLLQLRRPVEGNGPRQRLVEHASKRIDVRRGVAPPAFNPLRGGVVERADEHAGAGRPGISVELAGDPEIGQIDVVGVAAAVRDQHVGRLHVAVDEATPVSGSERRGDRGQKLDRAVGTKTPGRGDQRSQVCPVDPPHDQVKRAVELPGFVDRQLPPGGIRPRWTPRRGQT
jgi:hypothetical protein